MNKLKEWKSTLSSSTSFTYRLNGCHLKRGKSIINIGQNEQAAATHHFNDIQLDLKEKVVLKSLHTEKMRMNSNRFLKHRH